MEKTHKTKVLIIGSGPAGWTAAIYSARSALSPIVVEGQQPGGQLTITSDVENYPGFIEPIGGTELMQNMKKQAERFGTTIISDIITEVDFSVRPFVCRGESGAEYIADTVIIATGAQAKWLGLPSEAKYKGFGVSGCATCDGFFFRGKDVCVVGGGNTALEDALYLTKFANKVYLIHRRDQFNAEKIMQERVFKNPKIEIIWNTVVEEVIGEDSLMLSVTGVKVKNTASGQTTELKADGMFVAIGYEPSTKVFKGKLNMDEMGYILTEPNSTKTNVKGVFAAGDVRDREYRQAVTAAGNGCMAALEAERFLANFV
ncbi:MAG: thioredoxin-disulfide reductase [Alphaproteobacteria bacterium]|nr:thioredoxin-disulfide reductase [Alphaproteobacteria bacterium]